MKPADDSTPERHLNFPVFDVPQKEWDWAAMKLTLAQVTNSTEWARAYYMKHYYTPEERLRNKVAEPFRLE